jgi:hypothetical protein
LTDGTPGSYPSRRSVMLEPTAIPFNPVIPLHGDVKSFAMLGPYLHVERNDKIGVEKIPRPAKPE